MRLKNKVAIITGGSRGIGYATAEAFVREGATVILTASSIANAQKAADKLKEAYPQATVEGISPDLSSLESVREAFAAVAQRYGRIDILVNNAGVSESTPLTGYSEELFDKVMDLNVKGVFNTTRAVVEQMSAQGSGVILNTSSMVSIYGQPSGMAYPTSKFAVNGMTVSLARELGPKGIRVNAVAPGITETDMMKAVPKEVIEPMIRQIPLRRLGQPEDIANAFVFLASREASYITGVILSTSSMVSIYGQPSGIAYPASKFAVNGLTVSLARELGPKGIRVNAVAPGITETDMMKAVPKEVIEPMIRQIPLRRLGQPEDIANAFVFLASDEAGYITGVILSVDGMARS